MRDAADLAIQMTCQPADSLEHRTIGLSWVLVVQVAAALRGDGYGTDGPPDGGGGDSPRWRGRATSAKYPAISYKS